MLMTSHTLCARCNRLVYRGAMICQLCGEALLRTTAADIQPKGKPVIARLVMDLSAKTISYTENHLGIAA